MLRRSRRFRRPRVADIGYAAQTKLRPRVAEIAEVSQDTAADAGRAQTRANEHRLSALNLAGFVSR